VSEICARAHIIFLIQYLAHVLSIVYLSIYM